MISIKKSPSPLQILNTPPRIESLNLHEKGRNGKHTTNVHSARTHLASCACLNRRTNSAVSTKAVTPSCRRRGGRERLGCSNWRRLKRNARVGDRRLRVARRALSECWSGRSQCLGADGGLQCAVNGHNDRWLGGRRRLRDDGCALDGSCLCWWWRRRNRAGSGGC